MWAAPPTSDPEARISAAAAWADGVLLVWGGFPDLDDGYLLRPIVAGRAEAPA